MTNPERPWVSRTVLSWRSVALSGLLVDIALELALVALLVSLAWSSLALSALQETLR